MTEYIQSANVPVNYGKLLENQLKKWQGGGHHPRGIAEYISNSDDSYRRLKKFSDQKIIVEIHSRTGKKIDKLIIEDYAEGMSYDDLENKFFQYFESFSGREKGESVTGRFGTGGKAYAIMNFRHCWITSIREGKKCKAWFKWDTNNKQIIKGYNNGGFKDKIVIERNRTTVLLESSIKVSLTLDDFILHLEKLARNRHILKNQDVEIKLIKKDKTRQVKLKYDEPDPENAKRKWKFILPEHLKNEDGIDNALYLRYFEKPLGENAFIDLTDGISSVADLIISTFNGRPFSKYINGSVAITKLRDSVAVKENRRGLEEGDDLTTEIEDFLKKRINEVINEVEEFQRQQDKERRINAANEKLNELSKFLSKQDLKFKLELKELKKRFDHLDDNAEINDEENSRDSENPFTYRKPIEEDTEDVLVKGTWVKPRVDETNSTNTFPTNPEFIPDEKGEELAVKIGSKPRSRTKEIRKKKGLEVLMSNDSNNTDSPIFTEFDDPVSDRDLQSKGIIWINAVHPIIVKYGNEKENEIIRNENIANFVLMVVSQYYAQKEAEMQPEDEREDLLMLFRKHFFKLQMEIREDEEIQYFKSE